jgi:hypothetical protein
MTNDNHSSRSVVASGVLRWLERFLIATCGVLLGAMGSSKFEGEPLAVSMAIAARSNAANLPKTVSPPLLPERARSVIGIAMFANGSSKLTADAEKNVRLWGQALARCEGADLQLVGTTSSVPYRTGVAKNNPQLAAERASAVAALFRRLGLDSVGMTSHSQESELDAVRLVNDRPNQQPDAYLASVARRVDLNIQSLGACEFPQPALNRQPN